jgi:hypothetical protein
LPPSIRSCARWRRLAPEPAIFRRFFAMRTKAPRPLQFKAVKG